MGQIERWHKRKGKPDGLSASEVTRLVRRMIQNDPDVLPKSLKLSSLRLEDELSLGEFDDYAPEQGFVISPPGNNAQTIRWYEDVHDLPAGWLITEENPSDGLPPDPVETVTTRGGNGYIYVKWGNVPHSHPISYEVHISATDSFTPDETTLAAETVGLLTFIKSLPDNSPLLFDTPYYIKIVAKDVDGAADPSPEVEGEMDINGPLDLMVGTVTAEQLEAVMVLTTTMMAGNPDGSHVEIGASATHDGMLGIHAFAPDGETITFMLNAETGDVYVHGRIDFGKSRLTSDDIVEIHAQPEDFQFPLLIQSIGGRTGVVGDTLVSATWPTATTKGNLLFAVVALRDTDGTPPTPSTPFGWTQVANVARNAGRLVVYKQENAPARPGGTVQNVTLNDTVHATLQLFEFSGTGQQDVAVVTNQSGGTTPSVGPSDETTQGAELWLAAIANWKNPSPPTSFGATPATNPSDDFLTIGTIGAPLGVGTYPHIAQAVFGKVVGTIGEAEISATLSSSQDWMAALITFKAKVADVDIPDAGKVRIFSKIVGGVARLFVKHEDGLESALSLGGAYTPLDTPYSKGVSSSQERTLMELTNNLPNTAAPIIQDRVGAIYRVTVYGNYDHVTTGNLTLRLRAGSTLLNTYGLAAPGSNQTNQGFKIEGLIIVKATGATGLVAGGFSRYAQGNAVQQISRGFQETTVDLTAEPRVDVTAQYGAVNSSNRVTVEFVSVERVN